MASEENLEVDFPDGSLPEEDLPQTGVPDDNLPPLPDDNLGRTYILIARFTEQYHHHDDPKGKPNSKVWVVQAGPSVRSETGRLWSLWIDPEFYAEKQRTNSQFVSWIEHFDDQKGHFGFCYGRPMTSLYTKIPLCVAPARPRRLVSCAISPPFCSGLGALLKTPLLV